MITLHAYMEIETGHYQEKSSYIRPQIQELILQYPNEQLILKQIDWTTQIWVQ
jgi:hypothetical protein